MLPRTCSITRSVDNPAQCLLLLLTTWWRCQFLMNVRMSVSQLSIFWRYNQQIWCTNCDLMQPERATFLSVLLGVVSILPIFLVRGVFFKRLPFPYTQAKVLQLSDSSWYSNFSIFSFTVTTHSVWQASSILMTLDNKFSYTCETPFNNSLPSLFISPTWIRMIGFIILFRLCFSKEPWAKVMVHLNSKPNYNGKVKTCGELLALMLDQGCQFGWSVFFQWVHQSGKLSLNQA